jgi:hypothetical protein
VKKLREEKAENQVKYSFVLLWMNGLIEYFEKHGRPRQDKESISFVDFVTIHEPVIPPATRRSSSLLHDFRRFSDFPTVPRIDPDDTLEYYAEEEFYLEEARECRAVYIQRLFRGYLARRHVAWVQRMLSTVDEDESLY